MANTYPPGFNEDAQQDEVKSRSRPLGVAVLAILFVLTAFGKIEVGLRFHTGAALYLQVYQGLLSLVLGWGLWRGKRWGWALLIIVSAMGIAFDITVLFEPPLGVQAYLDAVGPILDVFFIFYATRRSVTEYFGVTSAFKEFA